ncbi:hypothetical protein ACG7TL_002029 [Trametes sanguinea]
MSCGGRVLRLTVKILKRCFRQPRPVTVIVNGRRRKKSYGMPSTHSAVITFFATYITLASAFLPIHPSFPSSPALTRGLPPLVVVPLASTIAASRIWLGHHTWPQVAAGCAYGLVAAPLWFILWTKGLNMYVSTVDGADAITAPYRIVMGMSYDYRPPHPVEQHERLVALRLLTDNDVPCIPWAEDAICYVYRVPTALSDQQILVPDELLETAANPPQVGSSRYVPKSIQLRHLDIPEDDSNKLEPIPGFIVLLPQSYFGLDVRNQDRLQSLVPPLHPSNSKILVPKYHTFLERLVNPPTRLDVCYPQLMSKRKHDIFISYLVHDRVEYGMDVIPPVHELYPEESKIMDEVQTDEARWYLRQLMWERKNVYVEEILEY